MSRLIDADKAVEVFAKRLYEISKKGSQINGATANGIVLTTCYAIAEREIDNIPTAYDIDKVVEELENKCISPNDYYGYVVDLEEAIEIVKRGGVDGNSSFV